MPAISKEPPKEGTYKFVMRRYDLACIQPQAWSTYDEATQSRAITFNGVEAQTLFLRDQAGAIRARRLGWKDETDQWMAHIEATSVKPTTEAQRKILEGLVSLSKEWNAKREIVDAAGIADTEWRTAIAYLEKLGLVDCNKSSEKSKKAATNRSFRYRVTDLGRSALEA